MSRRDMLKTATASSLLLAGAGGVVKPAFADSLQGFDKKADKGRKRVIRIRHGNNPPDGRTDTFFYTRGFDSVIRRPFAGETLEMPDDRVAGVVINGGSQALDDFVAYPWLKAEYRLIDECLKREIPLLGICMGAQQIALHLGGQVTAHENGVREFGYYEIRPTKHAGEFLTKPLLAPQYHWATFSIPNGATRLASSSLFENQAFHYGDKTYGVQFHPDVTIEEFRSWQEEKDRSWWGKPGTQSREEQDRLMHQADAPLAAWCYGFLERLFGRDGSIS